MKILEAVARGHAHAIVMCRTPLCWQSPGLDCKNNLVMGSSSTPNLVIDREEEWVHLASPTWPWGQAGLQEGVIDWKALPSFQEGVVIQA